MAPILKAIKKIVARKPTEAILVEELPLPHSSAAVEVLEQTMLSLKTNARDFCNCVVDYIRPHLEDKSQGEILFLSSVVLAVLLFVVIIPAYEARVRRTEEEVVVQELVEKKIVDPKFVRSSSGSDSSMETIEESEEEDEEQEGEGQGQGQGQETVYEMGVEIEFAPLEQAELEQNEDLQQEEKTTTPIVEEAKVEKEEVQTVSVGPQPEGSTTLSTQEFEAPSTAEVGQDDATAEVEAMTNDELEKPQAISTEMNSINEEATVTAMIEEKQQQEDPRLNDADNNNMSTPLPSTTTTTSDDDSALVAPPDTPTSSPPSSPEHRPSFKKKMSFGSFKNPKNNPVRRLSASMRRISSSKSVSSMK
ncbi:hypothetical protein ACHAXS_009427 [Conticribra weissflogii]